LEVSEKATILSGLKLPERFYLAQISRPLPAKTLISWRPIEIYRPKQYCTKNPDQISCSIAS
jgi:hypothetical protein